MAQTSETNANPYKGLGATVFDESRGFIGVNLYQNPQDQSGSMLLQADNVVNQAYHLVTRPGLYGLFGGTGSSGSSSTPSGTSYAYDDVWPPVYAVPAGAVYPLIEMEDGEGNLWLLFSCQGDLFKTQQGSGSYDELLDEFGNQYSSHPGGGILPNCDASRVGDFVYLDDGVHAPIRVSLAGGYPAPSMVGPADAPKAALTDTPVDAPTATNLSAGPVPSSFATLIANGAFDVYGAVSGNVYLPGTPWALTNGPYVLPANSPDYGSYSASAGHSQETVPGHNFSLLLDNPADSIGQTFSSVANNTTAWPNPSALTKCATFLFACQGKLQSSGSAASLAVTLIAYDSVGDVLGSQTQVLYPSSPTAWSQMQAAFNFSQELASDPDHYVLVLSSGPNNLASNGIWVATTSLTPLQDGPYLSNVGAQVRWTAPYNVIGGSYVVRDYTTAGKDFSSVGILGMAVSSAIDLSVAAPLLYLRFGFVEVGSATINWSNNLSFSPDGTFAYCDITTISSAVLASVRYLYIEAVLDLPVTSVAPGSNPNILTFGPFSAGGNLTVGQADYIWYTTESKVLLGQGLAGQAATNTIESNPSAASASLTPNAAQAQGAIAWPADSLVNSGANRVSLYRIGGAWSDYRLIATVTPGTAVAYGSDASNPYYSYDGSRSFVDNTPDLWLQAAQLMSFSKNGISSNAQCSAVWQDRLCRGIGNELEISWLLDSDSSAALMTTAVLNTSDPNYPIAGARFPISADPSDTIVRMISFGTPIQAGNEFGGGLLILNKRSIALVQGTDASNFSVKFYDYGLGCGLVAFRGVARVSPEQIFFLGPDRMHQFPPKNDSPLKDIGLLIQPAIYPIQPQTQQISTAFANSWLLYDNNALLLGCPEPGSGSNNVVWRFDFRTSGWLRWTGSTAAALNTTGAMSVPPDASGALDRLYLFSATGQIFQLTGTVDQATPVASPAAIPVTITVHAMRPGFFYRYKLRPLYYMLARLEWVVIEAVMTASMTVTAQAYNVVGTGPVAISGAKSVQTYELAGLGRGFRLNMPPGLIEGQLVTVTLSYATTTAAYLRGVRGWISGTSTEAM